MRDHPQRPHVMGISHILGVPPVMGVPQMYVCECSYKSGNHPSFGQFDLVYPITLDNFG